MFKKDKTYVFALGGLGEVGKNMYCIYRNDEIIIIDGESNDGTLDEVKSIQAEYCSDDFSISIIPNPKRILAAGWNLGIKAAKGEYVVRIDAHSVATEDFIAKSVETMMRVNAVCVGGKLISKSLNGDDDVVSKVLSSPFGVGNSSFRVSEQEGLCRHRGIWIV